ncbi:MULTISPECIES: DUF11 domain-containing protein [unclassified Roseivivax]|uniref:DUF11 domain-containing protein n=1 Tax=unclassified Roseivivax TaxID=2639302 RepID=UPI001561F756|nr:MULTISPECIES: DUF11 domain-containing protein [unclassified Roseivivax]
MRRLRTALLTAVMAQTALSGAKAGEFTVDWTLLDYPAGFTGNARVTLTDEHGYRLAATFSHGGGPFADPAFNPPTPDDLQIFGGNAPALALIGDAPLGRGAVGESSILSRLRFSAGGAPYAVNGLRYEIHDIDASDNDALDDRCDFVTVNGDSGPPILSAASATPVFLLGPGPGAGRTGALQANQAQCAYVEGRRVSPTSDNDRTGTLIVRHPDGLTEASITYDESIGSIRPPNGREDPYARGISVWGEVSFSSQDQGITLSITPDQTEYLVGDTVRYTYTITNAGDLSLNPSQSIVVQDARVGSVSCPAITTDIAPGGTLECTATTLATSADAGAGRIDTTAIAAIGLPGQTFADRLQSSPATASVAVVTTAPTPFTPGPGLAASQCGATTPTTAWEDYGLNWHNNDALGYDNARPDIFAIPGPEIVRGLSTAQINTVTEIERTSLPDRFDAARSFDYSFTTGAYTDIAEIWGVGVGAYDDDNGRYADSSGAFSFSVLIDDDPTFGSADVLLTQGQIDGVTFPGAQAIETQDTGWNIYGFGHFDADGTVVQINPNQTYYVRVNVYGDTRSGTHFGQFAPEIVLWDDFTLKTRTCPPPEADLSLTKTVQDTLGAAISDAVAGTLLDFTLTVTNDGPGTADGVVVRDLLPSGLAYLLDDAAAQGMSFDAATGLWQVGSVPAGQSRVLTIRATMQADGVHVNRAEIIASSVPDPDSDPAVGAASDDLGDGIADDDEASVSVTLRANAATLSGTIFLDTGAGGATAHDGTQAGAESGTSAALVTIADAAGTVLGTATPGSDGTWAFTLPDGYNGAVTVTLAATGDYLIISETGAPLPGRVLPDATDGAIRFLPDPATDYAGLDFGLIREATLTQDQEATIAAGQIVALRHEYLAHSAGNVDFALVDISQVPAGSFSATLFLDPACDGTPVSPVTGPMTVTEGTRICLVARVAADQGIGTGAVHVFEITAETSYTGTTIVERDTNTDRLSSQSEGSNLELSKTVENITRASGEGSQNAAAVGDVLEYRIYLRNASETAARNVTIYDQTPAYTRLAAPVPSPISVGTELVCNLASPATNAAGYAGGLRWDCTGDYAPGETGFVRFRVEIAP